MKKLELFDYQFSTYDLECRSLELGPAPISSMVCEIRPGSTSRIHNHAESETFLFLEGEGIVHSAGSSTSVRAGQGVQFEPFEEHKIENVSGERPLRLLSLYWMGDIKQPSNTPRSSKPALVFSTPPTPNGDLHLGHLSGPYLAADMARRAITQRNRLAFHVTGRDDNQTYVAMRSMSCGDSAERIADRFAAAIQNTLTMADVPLDGFIQPDRNGAYADFVAQMVQKLYDSGHIYSRKEPVLVGSDGAYLHEAYVRGRCPHCSAECDGNACEACGRPNACIDMVDPVDRRTNGPVHQVLKERLYFRFSAFAPQLSDIIKQTRLPAHVFALAQGMIDSGLPDICISNPSSWGLSLRIHGFEDQVLYVWFEMAAGYLFGAASTLSPGEERWAAARKAFSGDVDIIHAYGFDNAYYHALLFPAIYLALNLDLKPPTTHIVNELLDLDGKKFSTSRNHLIWGRDLLQQVPSDAVRYGLALVRPQPRRTNFSLDVFLADANTFFGKLNDWFGRAKELFGDSNDLIPDPGAWLADHRAYHARISTFIEMCERCVAVDSFAPHEMARELLAFCKDSCRFAEAQATLCTVHKGHGSDYLRTGKSLTILGIRCFAIMADCMLPVTCEAIRNALQIRNDPSVALTFASTGDQITWSALPFFPQFEAKRSLSTSDVAR